MSKQQTSKKALVRSCPWIVFTCLAVFFLMACANAYPGSSSASTATPTQTPASTTTTTSTSTATATPAATATSTPAQPGAAFNVTGIDMAVQPRSIAGNACGTPITVTYTATFHIAANSPGGTIQFTYTVNNGRGSAPASITVAPGQTTATYSFSWSGNLPADHTYPGLGGVMATSPNSITSLLLKPNGVCG